MTRFLRSEERPEGYKLEEILIAIRADILKRCELISVDPRPEALHVLNNNIIILQHITECVNLALDSTRTLDKAFGPSQAEKGGPPRIGESA
jgi:hypothetical protein